MKMKKACHYSEYGLSVFKKQRKGFIVGESRDRNCWWVKWDGNKHPQAYAKDFISINEDVLKPHTPVKKKYVTTRMIVKELAGKVETLEKKETIQVHPTLTTIHRTEVPAYIKYGSVFGYLCAIDAIIRLFL